MQALLVLLAVGLGWRSFWRGKRGRGDGAALEPDPAEELRNKLAERKAAREPTANEAPLAAGAGGESVAVEPEVAPVGEGPSQEEPPEEAPVADEAEPTVLDPVARRQAIHERARGAIEELK